MPKRDHIKRLLGNRMFRLTSGCLYTIRDRLGNIRPFIPNVAQTEVLKNFHPKSVILKARQLGMTTLGAILLLDTALFRQHAACGIVSLDTASANRILRDTIRFAYEHLPAWLKAHAPIITDREGELRFGRVGSSIRADMSFRGETLHGLLVSEYGPLSARNPKVAAEVRSGAFNGVHKSGWIWVESTAEGRSGAFADIFRQGTPHPKQPYEWKQYFFPWYTESAYTIIEEDTPIMPDTWEYFDTLLATPWMAKHMPTWQPTPGQMRWYAQKHHEQAETIEQEFPSTPDEAFARSVQGAYYGRELAEAERTGRVCHVPYAPERDVYTAWDLWGAGGGDDTAIWFFQRVGSEWHIIDYYEGTGKSMQDILDTVILPKPYTYGGHFFPHDAGVHEYSTGTTRLALARDRLQAPCVQLGRTSISDGINRVRQIFGTCYFDNENTKAGREHLEQYTRENDGLGGFANRPKHDKHAHAADAFRYLAQATEYIVRPKHLSFTLELPA